MCGLPQANAGSPSQQPEWAAPWRVFHGAGATGPGLCSECCVFATEIRVDAAALLREVSRSFFLNEPCSTTNSRLPAPQSEERTH